MKVVVCNVFDRKGKLIYTKVFKEMRHAEMLKVRYKYMYPNYEVDIKKRRITTKIKGEEDL